MNIYIKRTLYALFCLTLFVAAIYSWLYYEGKLGDHFRFNQETFAELPHWETDNHLQAFLSFKNSCRVILKQGAGKKWQTICMAAQSNTPTDDKGARAFFEKWFVPYEITNNFNSRVLFTGYYLPLLKGSFKNNATFSVPIYGVPRDLLKVKLSLFKEEYKNKKSLVGRQVGKAVIPYFDRQAIMEGAIKKTAKVLLWGDSLVDVFFAQIQGSAIVELPNGNQVVIGYAGDNGRAYTAIANVLLKRGALPSKKTSMQDIRNWFANHPNEIADVLNKDASYVFFTLMPSKDVVGTQGVPLTPERSLAVDTRYIPLGAPVWIATDVLLPNKSTTPFNHLLIAQDTGGAIKNMHGDIYWGGGERAAFIAGHLKNSGKWWLLLPR